MQHPIVREAPQARDPREQHRNHVDGRRPGGDRSGIVGQLPLRVLRALYRFRNKMVTPEQLAEAACSIEIDLLREPVGKQDQYVAACGGLNAYEFHPEWRQGDSAGPRDDKLRVRAARAPVLDGNRPSGPEILKDQDDRTRNRCKDMINNLHAIKQIGHQSRSVLEAGDFDAFGRLLHEHWARKRVRSKLISNPQLDHWYELGRRNGAVGGKLIGAGGGGFLMFVADDPMRLRAMEATGSANCVSKSISEGREFCNR